MTEVPEDQVRGLERDADAMEEGLEKLQGDIDTAHQRAEEARDRANPDAVAGDWQDESTGAQQGDDARDAEGAEGPGGESGGGGAAANAPVHEAEKVEPSGSGQSDSGEESDSGEASDSGDGPRGSVSMDDVPVHEAEQVQPSGEGDSAADDSGESS